MQTERIRRFLLVSLALLTSLAWLAEPRLPQVVNYFSLRAVFMQYSGAIAIGAMSLAMMLALRPRWLEPHLDGLDKIYRLHKWLGITALGVSVLHWWAGRGTKWMVGWGWLTRPVRGPRPAAEDRGLVEAWLAGQRGLAETVGEWAFYAAAVLMVLALVRRFPYHLFAKTHTWLAALYLALVFHSVVLVKFPYWGQPLGWVLAALMAGGGFAAVRLLMPGGAGAHRRVRATVEALERFPTAGALEIRVVADPGWPGHAPGQFAFLTTDPKEGAHPYTLASAWDPASRRLTFIAKALGDHTRRLPDELRVGQPVTLEGPYGRFLFEDGRPRQIWIGAGIGITPFIARMKHLAATGRDAAAPSIDLFHATAVEDPRALARLREDAQAAGVRLHVLVDGRDGLLDGERLRAAVPGWAQAGVWFCGPVGFGRALRQDLLAHGLPGRAFHQELFQMR